MRAADHDRPRAERERLDDIDAAAEAAVDQDRRPPADRVDDARQGADRSDRAVKLAPAVIGDNDPVGAAIDRFPRVVRMQKAFENERPAPLLAHGVDVAPADVGVELLEHQRAEGGERRALAVVGEGRRRRLRACA